MCLTIRLLGNLITWESATNRHERPPFDSVLTPARPVHTCHRSSLNRGYAFDIFQPQLEFIFFGIDLGVITCRPAEDSRERPADSNIHERLL